MKKDVVYIDTEDDITSIVGKVKAAQHKVVALVPPKRTGALQSAVNLKLLQKAAKAADKQAVLVTNDKSLKTLAAGVKIPVAKNLQSQPEILAADRAPILNSEDDVINGEELSVGELSKTAPGKTEDEDTIELPKSLDEDPTEKAAKKGKNAKKGKKNPIPNFNDFRKKIFLIVGGVVLFVLFLVWAIFFAPRATVSITAKTNSVNVDIPVTLQPNSTTDAKNGIVRPEVAQLKKSNSVDFTATGKKEVGEKASGTMSLSNSYTTSPISVAAGTAFSSSSGLVFYSNSAVTVPGYTDPGGGKVPGTARVGVTAAAIGSQYNVGSQSYSSAAGGVSATGSRMSGGSSKTITVVTNEDVQKATQQLADQDEGAARKELKGEFDTKTMTIINESFSASSGNPTATPGVGSEATKGQVTAETTYTQMAIINRDLDAVLNSYLKEQAQKETDQRVYDNGAKEVRFINFEVAPGGTNTVRINTTGYIGPKIEDKNLAKQLEGMNYGDIQKKIEVIEGVEDVDTKFWPFWVNKAPSADKITIKFTVSNKDDSN